MVMRLYFTRKSQTCSAAVNRRINLTKIVWQKFFYVFTTIKRQSDNVDLPEPGIYSIQCESSITLMVRSSLECSSHLRRKITRLLLHWTDRISLLCINLLGDCLHRFSDSWNDIDDGRKQKIEPLMQKTCNSIPRKFHCIFPFSSPTSTSPKAIKAFRFFFEFCAPLRMLTNIVWDSLQHRQHIWYLEKKSSMNYFLCFSSSSSSSLVY